MATKPSRAQRNPDRVRMFTPKGSLKWPKLTEIDYGTDKYPKPDGEYNVRMELDRHDPGVGAFLDKLDEMMERARELAEEQFAEMKVKDRKAIEAKGGIQPNQPYAEIYDEETEEPTGKVEFKAKMKAGGVRKKDGKKWSAKPDLFDAKGKPLPKSAQVWGGSVAIINFDAEPYFVAGTGAYGISHRLNAAQIIELVSAGGQRSASSYGFGEHEGFSADEHDFSDADDDSTDDQTDSSDDDDDDDVDF